jgi:hypothetical protein
MRMVRLRRINVCAPAVVVLATVVNAAAASDCVFAAPTTASHDLSCVIGSGSHSVQSARTHIAKKAARTIDSLDKLSGADAAPRLTEILQAPAFSNCVVVVSTTLDPASSSHQYSAP